MELNKFDGETRNLETDNVSALAAAFPEVVADGKVDFEKLRLILGEDIDDSEERYSFNWPGKRDAIKMAISRTTGTLRPDKANSKDWDTTQNLFIEGDNLEVLRSLQNSYRGKVKMIYIDPPYNTGKDFVYKDDFKDNIRNYKENASLEGQSNPETAGRYHTNWLNMMYPRLRLAKNLLRDDGVIFISIDDHEVHNLRKTCDEIFGESNFLKLISRVTGTPTGGGFEAFVNKVDYVLVYQRTKKFVVSGTPLTEKEMSIYDKEDERGSYLSRSLRRTGGEDRREDRPSMFYKVTAPDGSEVLPYGPTGYESRWICGRDKFSQLEVEGLVEWIRGNDGYRPQQKFYLEGRLKQPSNLWDDMEGNKKATRDIRTLFDSKKVFDFPKPVGMLQYAIQVSGVVSKDIVLDFFAGSATSAHAILKQNAEDGGNRRFIMVQIPEATPEESEAKKAGYRAISEISRKRIDLAGEKIKEDYKDKLVERETPLDVGFKAFVLDTTNFREWDTNTANIEQSLLDALNTFKDGRNEEDALYEVLLKYGVDLAEPVEQLTLAGKQVYSLAGNYLLVCLEKNITLDTVEAMAVL